MDSAVYADASGSGRVSKRHVRFSGTSRLDR